MADTATATTARTAPRRTARSREEGRAQHGFLREVRTSMPRLAWWVVCLCLAVAFLYPLWVMLSMALKGPAEQGQIPPTAFPHAPTLGNFTHLASVQGLNVFGNQIGRAHV